MFWGMICLSPSINEMSMSFPGTSTAGYQNTPGGKKILVMNSEQNEILIELNTIFTFFLGVAWVFTTLSLIDHLISENLGKITLSLLTIYLNPCSVHIFLGLQC